jgi:UrcA family protein
MTASLTQFRFTPLVACGLAALFVSLAGTNAFAAAKNDGSVSIKVQYSPRDLNTSEGSAKVYGKIKAAARRVCHQTMESWDPARTRHYWECYALAVGKAVDDINSKNLTALHQQDAKQDAKHKRPS